MNIICDKTLLSAAIDGVSKAVTLRSTIPVLEGILLKAEGFQLTLTGYDLEMGIVTTIDANVKEPGEVVLNAKLLSSMVSRMPSGQINIQSAENGKTTIQSGVAQFEIQSMNPTDFPELPNTGAEETLTIKTGEGSTEKSRSWQLEIVGVLTPDGAKGYWTQSGIVLRIQDMKMLQKVYNDMTKTKTEEKSYEQVYVKVDDLKNVTDVETAIHELGFTNTYSMNQQREEMQQQVIKSQMIFGGIAAVSLFVAAINIINTMTMAIYERTREIGVMKVLGCELGSIRTMFLLESSTIGFIGGLIGVAFSLLASFVLNNLSTILAAFGQGGGLDLSGLMGGGYYYMDGGGSAAISIIPPWLMLAALVFATLVGLVAGILPANKAVRISALEAIRHD